MAKHVPVFDENEATRLIQNCARQNNTRHKKALIEYIMPWVEETKARIVAATDENALLDPHAVQDITVDTLLEHASAIPAKKVKDWKQFAKRYQSALFNNFCALATAKNNGTDPLTVNHTEQSSLQSDTPRRAELKSEIALLMETLTPRERQVLDLRMKGYSGKKAGVEIGVSGERVNELDRKISWKLRRVIERIQGKEWNESGEEESRLARLESVRKSFSRRVKKIREFFPLIRTQSDVNSLANRLGVVADHYFESQRGVYSYSESLQALFIDKVVYPGELEGLLNKTEVVQKLADLASPTKASKLASETPRESFLHHMKRVQELAIEDQAICSQHYKKPGWGNYLAELKHTGPDRKR